MKPATPRDTRKDQKTIIIIKIYLLLLFICITYANNQTSMIHLKAITLETNGMNKIQHKFYTKCANKSLKWYYRMCDPGVGRDKKSFNHYPKVI